MDFAFILSAFFAGILIFLAPCTLPLVPAYLSFISGVSLSDLQNPQKSKQAHVKVFLNAFLYVIGFSSVFIFFGSLFGLGGSFLFPYRDEIARIGGIFVIFFGLFLLAPTIEIVTRKRVRLFNVFPFSLLRGERQCTVGLSVGISSKNHCKHDKLSTWQTTILKISFLRSW